MAESFDEIIMYCVINSKRTCEPHEGLSFSDQTCELTEKRKSLCRQFLGHVFFKIFQQKHHLAKTRLTRGIINNILMTAVLITNTGKFRNDSSLKRKQKQQHYDARFERVIREYFQFQFV